MFGYHGSCIKVLIKESSPFSHCEKLPTKPEAEFYAKINIFFKEVYFTLLEKDVQDQLSCSDEGLLTDKKLLSET